MCFEKMQWGFSEVVNASVHCVQYPWNLLVEIFGALGMKGSHFLSKNVFWENAVEYLRNGEC